MTLAWAVRRLLILGTVNEERTSVKYGFTGELGCSTEEERVCKILNRIVKTSFAISGADPGFFNGGWLIQSATKLYVNNISYVSHDHRSYERNLSNCVEKPEKVRTSTGFEPVTSRYRCDALTN